MRGADHEETNPGGQTLAITALSCSLVGQRHDIRLAEGSLLHGLYGRDRSSEDYFCNYGVNPALLPELEKAGLTMSAFDDEGEVRAVELRDHPFFIGTLFMPQTRSTAEHPHPVLSGFRSAVERCLTH